MKHASIIGIRAMALLAALVMAGLSSYAQSNGAMTPDNARSHHRYQLVDLGTLGGSLSSALSLPRCLVSGGKLTGGSLTFGGSIAGFCYVYPDPTHCRAGAAAINPGRFRCRNGVFNVDLGLTACGAPPSAGVHICAPSGLTVVSPVLVEAASTVSGTIARMELWVDGMKKYTAASSRQLNTSIGLAAGGHRFAVLAVNTAGQKWESVVYATVK